MRPVSDAVTCPVPSCGLTALAPRGFCWPHFVAYVVAAYRPGMYDATPIKAEILRRQRDRHCSRGEIADTLGVSRRDLERLCSWKTQWLSHRRFDRWSTLLGIDVPELWEAA